jgi:hypothetical protein
MDVLNRGKRQNLYYVLLWSMKSCKNTCMPTFANGTLPNSHKSQDRTAATCSAVHLSLSLVNTRSLNQTVSSLME